MKRLILCLSILPLLSPPAAQADDFPPISDAERAMTAVDWQPGAAAVVLYRNAELRFRDYVREANSRLTVEQRVKILTDEGVEAGVREISHNRFVRLGDVEARTVTPDGKAIPVPEDALFTERRSRSSRQYVTKVTFPSVTKGAILDLRFEIFWDSFYYLDPWLFHQDLPVLSSKISYIKPDNLAVTTWGRQTGPQEFQSATSKAPGGTRIDISMQNLDALPNEPFSFPDTDLSSRFMIVPKEMFFSGTRINLLSSWDDVCDTFENEIYVDFFKNQRRSLRKKAQELTRGLSDDAARLQAIFAFVRDDIETGESLGIFVSSDRDAGEVLDGLSGTPAEKALVLQAMLDLVKIDSTTLWTADRRENGVAADLPNPAWFTGMIVEAEAPGRTVYLDPSDRGNGVGTLIPYLEGTIAVDCSRKKDRAFNLPRRSPQTNQRTARVKLALDEEGQLGGEVAMLLEGHPAWSYLGIYDDEEAKLEAWQESLAEDLPGFLIDGLSVEEDVEGQQVTVRFQLTQREEDVLGDEASWNPSRPFERSQLFSLPVEKRRTPVLMPYGHSDQLILEATWPEGWTPDIVPQGSQHGGPAGGYSTETKVDEGARTLRYERSFSRPEHTFIGDEAYAALRSLYQAASTHDAQDIVWIRQ